MSRDPPRDHSRGPENNSSGSTNVPQAPYPPFVNSAMQMYPSTQVTSLRSSLSSSPHYSTGSSPTFPAPTGQSLPTIPSAPPNTTANEGERQVENSSKVLPRQIQFCQPNLLACINCVPSDGFGEEELPDSSSPTPRRRKRPILLEFKKLEIHPSRISPKFDGTVVATNHPVFTTETVMVSYGNPLLGSSVMSTCLDVKVTTGQRPLHVLSGLGTGALALHCVNDTSTGDAISVDFYHMPRNHRPATAVSWRPQYNSHALIGLVANGTTSNHRPTGSLPRNRQYSAPRISSNNMGSSSNDKEYGALLWDVEYQNVNAAKLRTNRTTPLLKLAHQVVGGAASLAWLNDESSQLLAVGGQVRNLYIYDLRNIHGPPVVVHAHSFGVHGVHVDPHRSWQFVTYSRAVQEPVKLWDARCLDACVSEIKLLSDLPVADARWSHCDASHLCIAVGNMVHEYDVSVAGTRPMHINTISTADHIQSFCLYPFASNEVATPQPESSISDRLIHELYPSRLLAVNSDGSVLDQAKHTLAPVALSRRDGRFVHAISRTLWVGSSDEGPAAMEHTCIRHNEDVSATMMRRARCVHVAKYSMDPASNLKLLALDGIVGSGPAVAVSAAASPGEAFITPSNRDALLRLWSWIDRVEALCNDEVYDVTEDAWPAKGLLDAGAYQLLLPDKKHDDQQMSCELLCCDTYDSPGRRAALTSCGWAGKFELLNVLGECEDLGEFERSAALAAFHADIGAAVDALQRGASHIRTQTKRTHTGRNPRITIYYAETLELVSLCVAGFRGGDVSSSSFKIWRKSCMNLMQRGDLSGAIPSSRRIAYIRSLLRFLLCVGFDTAYQDILAYSELSLCDRVAFACRFLPRHELVQFLNSCIAECQKSGNIEGITITGVEREGIKIMQTYIDRYADVQTAALVTSRVIFPRDWEAERMACSEWLEAYRSLLNTWQMWQSRAMFDVDRADLLRKVKKGLSDSIMSRSPVTHHPGRRLPVPTTTGRKMGAGVRDPDIQSSIPAQLDARCNYCSSPLGLTEKGSNANQWLDKMKPVLSCCPQCRKPLPRCAICMLSLGALNPYLELARQRSRPGRGGGQPAPEDLSSLANLPFAEWFTWCMRCKHGGHAHHLVGWFATHNVCPVSGCDCRCQFDGIQKLNRPALSAHNSLDGEDDDITLSKEMLAPS